MYGNKWKYISKELTGRSENSIKNKFFSRIKKGLRNMYKLSGYLKSRSITKKVNGIKSTVIVELLKKKLVFIDNDTTTEMQTLELLRTVSFRKCNHIPVEERIQLDLYFYFTLVFIEKMNEIYKLQKESLKHYEFFRKDSIVVRKRFKPNDLNCFEFLDEKDGWYLDLCDFRENLMDMYKKKAKSRKMSTASKKNKAESVQRSLKGENMFKLIINRDPLNPNNKTIALKQKKPLGEACRETATSNELAISRNDFSKTNSLLTFTRQYFYTREVICRLLKHVS